MTVTVSGGITFSGGGFTFTPAAAAANDPYFMYNSLLLPGDGTNLAQNNTFLDGSTNNFTITRNGNTTQGTFSPYGANWSNYFDGTGDYLQCAYNSAFDLSSSDFTIESWVNTTDSSSNYPSIIGRWQSAGNACWDFRPRSTDIGNYFVFVYSTNGTTPVLVNSNTVITDGVWHHLVAVRSGNNFALFVDGIRKQTASFTGVTIFNSVSSPLYVGYDPYGATYYTGYQSNTRLVKGTAVYDPTLTTLTVPTTPLTAIANTSLLTCQSNRFIDNSANVFAITRNGDVSVQRFSPFSPTQAYSSSTIGGSGYFDGSGDYLACGSQSAYAFGTGAFTVETWIYVTSRAAEYNIVATRTSAGSSTSWSMSVVTSGGITVYTDGFVFSNVGTVPLNAWTHVAFVREGTSTNQTKVYINGVSVASTTNSQNFTTNTLAVGCASDGSQFPFLGYISDTRLVKGTAVYTSSFTPPTAPLTAIANTSLLVNYTNGGIIDNAMMNNLETVGNAQISTAQSKFGGSSMAFDGTGDYLTAPTTTNLSFGAGDFTVEAWVYLTANPANANGAYLTDFRANGSTSNFAIGFIGSGAVTKMYAWVNATADITGSATVTLNTWNHVAYVRSGTTVTAYLNGTANGTMSSSYSQPSTGVAIGSRYTGSEYITGYVDDLRITKGLARYTTTFTPPTAALPTY